MNMTRDEVAAILARQQKAMSPILNFPMAPAKRGGRGIIRTPGRMNKTETRYARELELQKQRGEILWWRFEGITLKLAHDTRLTVDFAVMMPDGVIELRDVKGFFEDDAKVKTKVAAEMFPFVFKLVRAKAQREGGGFEITEVTP